MQSVKNHLLVLKYHTSLKISVIIPVRNGNNTLAKCLESLLAQATEAPLDIIILDSMSTDGSRETALKYGAKLVDVMQGTFDHGLTRNLGIAHAEGDLVYFTVQDAWIANSEMLNKMSGYFKDEKVVAVGGHQAVPHEKDKNPMKWYRRFSEPVVEIRQLEEGIDFESLDQERKKSLIAWDNVVAMYRKRALLEQPFIATEMSEDWVWSRDAIIKGWTLVYDPSLLVYHYHHESYRYIYEVSYSVNYHFYKYFGFKPSMPAVLPLMARATWHLGKNKELPFLKKVYWIFNNYISIVARMNSTLNFLFYLKAGGINALTKQYAKVCKTIPQGIQNKL